jgi:hypothetical protein
MERMRVAGRFVRQEAEGAEGEGGIAKRVRNAAPRPKFCRTFTRHRLAEALPEIAERFVEEAKKGSIQHAKVLMRLGGLEGRDMPKPAKRRGKSFAGRLLEELRGPSKP